MNEEPKLPLGHETPDSTAQLLAQKHLRLQPPKDFVLYFGLRDFMYFMKLLGRLALDRNGNVTSEGIIHSLQRNMNGVQPAKVLELLEYFMAPFDYGDELEKMLCLRNPFGLLQETLSEQAETETSTSRYPMVIDTTSDDSILRALRSHFEKNNIRCSVLKLSHFPEDNAVQQINIISRVKWAAEAGEVVILSQTGTINESFYDLLNQHFRKSEEHTEEGTVVTYTTNIAIGAHSRRCKVAPGFQCIVHFSLPELQLAPAPFLNRFEKYRLSHADLLTYHLQQRTSLLTELPSLNALLRDGSSLFRHLQTFTRHIGARGVYGFQTAQTIESGLLCIISSWNSAEDVVDAVWQLLDNNAQFQNAVVTELNADVAAKMFGVLRQMNRKQVVATLTQPKNDEERRVWQALLGQTILHQFVALILRVTVPEQLFRAPTSFPRGLLELYLEDGKHFSLSALAQSVVAGPVRKHIVYTRTSPLLLSLQAADAASMQTLHQLVNSEGGQLPCSVVSFSRFTRQPQLVKELSDFQSPDDPRKLLFLIVDSSQTSNRQMNFLRYQVDEMERASIAKNEDIALGHKSIVLLLHFPLSDLQLRPCYSTTFCADWTTSFLDSVAGEETVKWLRLAAGWSSNEDWLSDVFRSWCPQVMHILARFVNPKREAQAFIDAIGRNSMTLNPLERRSAGYEALLKVSIGEQNIADILIRRFTAMWPSEDGPFDKLRILVQSQLCQLAAGTLQVPLQNAMTDNLRSMFTKYLAHMLCTICKGLNANVVQQLNETSGNTTQVVEECIMTVTIPPLGELIAPLRPLQLSAMGPACRFPFFSAMTNILDAAAAHANRKYEEYDGDDVWEVLIAEVCSVVNSIDDRSAGAAAQRLIQIGAWEDPFLNSYLHDFVERLCTTSTADGPQSSLQIQIVTAWLTSHQCVQASQSKLAARGALS